MPEDRNRGPAVHPDTGKDAAISAENRPITPPAFGNIPPGINSSQPNNRQSQQDNRRTPQATAASKPALRAGNSAGQARFAANDGPVYGALDLGTNNCRLLLARPTRRGFRVIDAFSRIIRLGEGVSQTNRLSDDAMRRTMDALKICAGKIERQGALRTRMVATQACRMAENGPQFIENVRNRFGLDIEVLTPEIEAQLAVSGCASLIDAAADYVVVFDIGGGSSEIIWLDVSRMRGSANTLKRQAADAILAWTSLPVGVVTLAEGFDGRNVTPQTFAAMSDVVFEMLRPFEAEHRFRERISGRPVHMLGTSGTVTTIAGIKLALPRYDRNRVDGLWLDVHEVHDVTRSLLDRTYEQRVAEPCIGRERADLVLAGCAILDAILRLWPADRLRVADRGLREGILTNLMYEDGVWRPSRRRASSRRFDGARD